MEVTRNEDINFLKYIKWRAIFDFNKNGGNDCAQAYLEEKHDLVFNTNFIEDFDPRKVDESRVHQTVDNLKSSSLPNWIPRYDNPGIHFVYAVHLSGYMKQFRFL
jgi:hypothetical protein